MRKPLAFQKAASLLPSGSTGGMLILFQPDHRHPEFPVQVSGVDGNYSSGQLESPVKDFRNKLSWRIGLLLQFHRLGTLAVSFYFPSALFFRFLIEVQLSVSTGIAQISFRGGCLRDSSKEGQITLIPQLF